MLHSKGGEKLAHEDVLSELHFKSSSGATPAFRNGQVVLHFWASWMATATAPLEGISKKKRPAWYSAEILSPPFWGEYMYSGFTVTSWAYKVF